MDGEMTYLSMQEDDVAVKRRTWCRELCNQIWNMVYASWDEAPDDSRFSSGYVMLMVGGPVL